MNTTTTQVANQSPVQFLIEHLVRECRAREARMAELKTRKDALPPRKGLEAAVLQERNRQQEEIVTAYIALGRESHAIERALAQLGKVTALLEPLGIQSPVASIVGQLQRQLADAEGDLEEIAALPDSAICTDTEMDERYANGRIKAYREALELLTGTPEPPPADQIAVACLAIQRLAGEAALTADTIENQPEERIDYERLEQLRTSREAYLAALRAVLAIEPQERPSTQAEILEAIQQQQREANEACTRLLAANEDVGPETQLQLYRLKVEHETWGKALELLSTPAPISQ